MARKLPLAELSIVVDGTVELPATLATNGYRGEWHAKTFDDTLLALAGHLLPDGSRLDGVCSNWSGVFGGSTEFSQSLPIIGPQDFTVSSGQNWLVVAADEALFTQWLEWAEQALKSRELGWLTVYQSDGQVLQWNRASLTRWFGR